MIGDKGQKILAPYKVCDFFEKECRLVRCPVLTAVFEFCRSFPCVPLEGPVEAAEVIEAHIVSDGKDLGTISIPIDQHFFRFLDPVAVDKLVEILAEFFVDHLRKMMGGKRHFPG